MTNDVAIAFADRPSAIHDNGSIRRRIVLLVNGDEVDVVSCNLDSIQARDRLVNRWASAHGIERSLLSAKLTKAAVVATSESQADSDPEANAKPDDGSPRRTQADKLVEIVEDAELFHGPGDDGEAYATIAVGDHRETHAVNRRSFRRWLAGQYWQAHEKAPGGQAIQDAIGVIASRGIYAGPEFPIAVRVAEHDGCHYLDLGNDDWTAVRVACDGWEVVSDPPVKFVRPRGLAALPDPVAGGSIAELRQFINVPDDDAWALIVCWVVSAFRAVGPYPLLCLHGEQGSAKSTTSRMVRALIDPNQTPVRSEPRDCRDLMIAASNSWCLVFDNLSKVSPTLSDGLCRLATGGGFATRELYTDGDEVTFNAMRPVLVNGINELATRGDLLDRAIVLTLQPIAAHRRRTEADLWPAFYEARPRILGAILDAVAHAMRMLPTIRLAQLPRMADFAVWATAAEPAMEIEPGAFLRAYQGNRAESNESAIEASAIGAPVLALIADVGRWAGTASELLTTLESDRYTDERTRRRKNWPRSGRGTGGALRRIAPNLRASGIEVDFDRAPQVGRDRMIHLERVGAQPSEPSEPSTNPAGDPDNSDSGWTVGQQPTVQDRPQPSKGNGVPGTETHIVDGLDGLDGSTPPESKTTGTINRPNVPDGWTPTTWATKLRKLADECESHRPELAAQYRAQAEALDDPDADGQQVLHGSD